MGSKRLLLVGVSFNNVNLETVTSVSYDGISLTPVGTSARMDDARVEIWQLVNPPLGTADVEVTFSNSLTSEAVAGALTVTGVDQADPLGPFGGGSGSGPTASVTVPTTDDELALAVFGCETCSSVSGAAPATEWWNETVSGGDVIAAGFTQPGGSIQATFDAFLGASDHWAFAAVSIHAAPPEPTPTPTNTPIPTPTDTPTPTPTHTPTPLPTDTPTPTPTDRPTATPTDTPTPTYTPTAAPTHTATPPPVMPSVVSVSTGNTRGGSISFGHTSTGTNRLLLVGVSINNGDLETVSSVSYGGVALTFVGAATRSNDARVEIWQLQNPPVGTADVVVNLSTDLRYAAIASAVTISGVDHADPLGDFVGSSGSGNASTLPVTSTEYELVLAVFACETCSSVVGSPPASEQWNEKVGNGIVIAAGFTQPGQNPQVTFDATLGSSDHWAFAAVPIRPASGP